LNGLLGIAFRWYRHPSSLVLPPISHNVIVAIRLVSGTHVRTGAETITNTHVPLAMHFGFTFVVRQRLLSHYHHHDDDDVVDLVTAHWKNEIDTPLRFHLERAPRIVHDPTPPIAIIGNEVVFVRLSSHLKSALTQVAVNGRRYM
jgi:hypothetical protein